MRKSITLEHTGYRVTGTAYVTLWGGDNGTITMKPFQMTELTEAGVIAGLNDNGFGVQSIDGADCDIYAIYGKGYMVNIGWMTIKEGKCVNKKIEDDEQ